MAQATEALLIELGEEEPLPGAQELKLFEVKVRHQIAEFETAVGREIEELKGRIEALEGKPTPRPWWQKLLMLPRGD